MHVTWRLSSVPKSAFAVAHPGMGCIPLVSVERVYDEGFRMAAGTRTSETVTVTPTDLRLLSL